MSNVVQLLSEITDSREMLEAKPHKFTSIFAYILIAILVIALTWTYFGELDVVVKSNGIVKSNDKTLSVLNEVDGKVSEVDFKEGQKVKKGDVLFTLECKDALLSKSNYDKQLQTLQTETDNMDKLRNSIMDNKNYFDATKLEQKGYYNKYIQYSATNEKVLLTQSQTALQISATNDNKVSSSKSLTQQIGDSNEVINSLDTLLSSINNNKSLFSDNDMYASQYSDYQLTIQNLNNAIEQKKAALQNAKDKYTQATTDYQSQTDNAQTSYNNAVSKLQQYKSQYIAQISNSLTQASSSLSDVQFANPTTSTQITQLQNTISNLQLLIKSINTVSNLFSDSNSTYYKQYVDYTNNLQIQNDKPSYTNSYLLSVNQNIDSAQSTLAQYQSTSSAAGVKSSNINQTIYNLQLLQSSINNNQNYFTQTNLEYYNKFIDYQNSISQLQNDVTTEAKLISSLDAKKAAFIDDYNTQLTAAQKLLDSAGIDLSKYQNSAVLDIKTKVDDASKTTKKMQSQLEQAKITPDLDNINNQLAANDITKYKMDTLVQLDDGVKQNQQKIDELKTNIDSLQLTIDKSTVKSPIDGIVNIKADISKDQLLKGGQEIVSVIPQSSSQYRVQLYVSNQDIAGMKVGEKIKYHLQALPYKEYGELTGTITDIAVDSTVDQQSGSSYYLVQSEIQNKPLFSYKGEKGELKVGMTCEAQVITTRKKILYYLLEKLNFMN